MSSILPQILGIKIRGMLSKPLPIKLTIATTFMCNSKCRTCGIWKIYKEHPEKVNEEIDYEIWIKLFDEIGKYLGWIEFTGGEPFLRKDISEIVIYAYNYTNISAGGLTTNGIMSKKIVNSINKIIENIPKNKILNVGVSLDGIPEIHNEIRGIRCFEQAIKTFTELKELAYQYDNLIVHLAYTISRYNAGKFKEFYEFIKGGYDVSIDEITVTFEHFTEYYKHDTNNRTTYDYFKERLLNDISEFLKLLKNKSTRRLFEKIKLIFYKFYLKNIIKFVNNPKGMIIPCVAGTYSAYIDPYGNVYPCTQWLTKLGNIKENSFKEIWWNQKAERVRISVKNGKCPNCWTPCEAQPSWLMNFGLLRGWW